MFYNHPDNIPKPFAACWVCDDDIFLDSMGSFEAAEKEKDIYPICGDKDCWIAWGEEFIPEKMKKERTRQAKFELVTNLHYRLKY